MEVSLTTASLESPSLSCHPADCHYLEGDLPALVRSDAINLIFEDFGLELARFRPEWISAFEGQRLAHAVTEMVEQVRNPGPSPYRTQ